MIKRILIANRGEIAVRVIRTCREMGIETVAVFSDADREALHVLEADRSVYLGAAEPGESYLNIDKIMKAVRESGADAVHPGYGFFAENAAFAERCAGEKIIFIGPGPDAIKKLGDKIKAREIMISGGVPVVPGFTMEKPDPVTLAAEAEKIGYPVLIKAAAGGGGKGIRIVNSPSEMKSACESAASEALSAFGSSAIFMEKYITKARHVEFQILADTHGNVIHLNERECSIQRRHQKIIEESPSPAMTPELRKKMGEAAVKAAEASGYVNAGTVEFLLDENGNFYFLEVNTRLQVEHPVTELVTGIDLVREQIKIASGEKLSIRQEDTALRGHAIECRIYAEDPENGFFPSPGKIRFMKEPSGPGIRNDCGVYTGFTVPVEYDPILSKLIVHAADRDAAIKRMTIALKNYILIGVKTAIPFMAELINSAPFKAGDTFTDFIGKHFTAWKPESGDVADAAAAFIADELSGGSKKKYDVPGSTGAPSPWETLGAWRIG